jgi:hypothetical protein
MQAYIDKADTATIEALEAQLLSVGGGLAPIEPGLQWSLSKRDVFLDQSTAEVVREYPAGLFIIRHLDQFYVARKFMRTGGWVWSCVPVVNAQPDNKMLHSMMDGSA